jgi:hypothetical protein
VIGIVGHSQYFKSMLGIPAKFENCDVWEVKFDFTVELSPQSAKEDVNTIQSAKTREKIKKRFSFSPSHWKILPRMVKMPSMVVPSDQFYSRSVDSYSKILSIHFICFHAVLTSIKSLSFATSFNKYKPHSINLSQFKYALSSIMDSYKFKYAELFVWGSSNVESQRYVTLIIVVSWELLVVPKIDPLIIITMCLHFVLFLFRVVIAMNQLLSR